VRYAREDLDRLIDDINAIGYGLTFGLHTRLDETIAHVGKRIRAGNIYVNRNVIGAVVGVQPFGGRGLSGTGPKAGGPLYLGRLVAAAPPIASLSSPADPALADFAAWLDHQGETDAAQQARHYAAISPLGFLTELPGPVGEKNLYALHPRGCILLVPATRNGLYRQIAAILATGNDAVVEGWDMPPDLPASVLSRLHDKADGPLAGALVEGDRETVGAIVRRIAAMPGPILLAQAESADRTYRLDWLVEEVSTSINTTAAGGNASLMMIG
jgi:RHH-type proline utilization regulon transcriptional repressor/proline dehydrogenase/delta 1-pyrroline-5-carboxylate dehydrogenase